MVVLKGKRCKFYVTLRVAEPRFTSLEPRAQPRPSGCTNGAALVRGARRSFRRHSSRAAGTRSYASPSSSEMPLPARSQQQKSARSHHNAHAREAGHRSRRQTHLAKRSQRRYFTRGAVRNHINTRIRDAHEPQAIWGARARPPPPAVQPIRTQTQRDQAAVHDVLHSETGASARGL